MTIQVAALKWVPDFVRGYVRDLRVRWALEEAGLAYEQVLIDPETQKSPDYRRWQPFGQVPAYRDGEVEMFESGAIVLYISECSEALAPRDPAGRARVATWVVAALNSIEPFAANVIAADLFYAGEPWAAGFRTAAMAALKGRLEGLSDWLGDKDYLEHHFTAGDLIMSTVFRSLDNTDALSGFPNLEAYHRRCEARPAFERALQAQLQSFQDT